MLRFLMPILLLLLISCSGGGSSGGGTAAPPPGPSTRSSAKLIVELPAQGRIQASGIFEPITLVSVEIVDEATPDPGTLSGKRVLASGQASVAPGDRQVTVLLSDVPVGPWTVYTFGKSSSGRVVARSVAVPLQFTPTQVLVQTLELVPIDDTPTGTLAITPLNPSVDVGVTQAFQALLGGADATGQVTWSSGDPSIATIDPNGVATGVAAGTTTISATLGSQVATTNLTVTTPNPAVTLTSIDVTPAGASLVDGTTLPYTATGTFSDGSSQDLTTQVTWSSSDPSIAGIDSFGLATGVNPGPVTITATQGAVSGSTGLTVTNALLVSLDVSPDNPTIQLGTQQFTVVGTFTDGTTQPLTNQVAWTSSNLLAATINAAGLATKTGAGVTTIAAALNGVSDSTTLTTLASSGTFAAAINSFTGNGPQSIFAGDLNGDNIPDVVTANNGADNIGVALGNGDGTLQAATFVNGNAGEFSVALGDLNEDGILDIACANFGSDDVSILLGNGNGTFGPAANSATGNAPVSVTLADVNLDNFLDVMVANQGSNTVSVLLGNGDGTLQPDVQTPGVGSFPALVRVGDMNNDGFPDLVTGNQLSNNISVLLGNGDGTFQAALNAASGTFPVSVALGDLNSDGRLDVATQSLTGNTVIVQLGNGDGTLQAPQPFVSPAGPVDVVVADIDGSGTLDVVSANQASASISYFRGNGDGTLQAATDSVVGTSPRIVFSLDMNGDGLLDVLTANSGSNNVSILLQIP